MINKHNSVVGVANGSTCLVFFDERGCMDRLEENPKVNLNNVRKVRNLAQTQVKHKPKLK